MTKIDINKPVELTDGRKARIICSDYRAFNRNDNLIVAVTDGMSPDELIYVFTREGKSVYGTPIPSLRNKPQEKWVAIYKNNNTGEYLTSYRLYNSYDEAKCAVSPTLNSEIVKITLDRI